jgi:hypothetical protein
MNDVIKGLLRIRNAIIGALLLSLATFGIGALNRMINDNLIKIITFILLVILFVWSIILIVQFFSGFGLIRKANLVNKLNQRIDELKIYMISSFLLCFLYIALVILGAFLLLLPLVYLGFVILLIALILSLIAAYRTIQIQGILGVFADSAALKNKAVSMLFLFKIQIGNMLVLNAAGFFKRYLDIGYYFILIPSILFSLYMFVMFVDMYNLSIDVYQKIERDSF